MKNNDQYVINGIYSFPLLEANGFGPDFKSKDVMVQLTHDKVMEICERISGDNIPEGYIPPVDNPDAFMHSDVLEPADILDDMPSDVLKDKTLIANLREMLVGEDNYTEEEAQEIHFMWPADLKTEMLEYYGEELRKIEDGYKDVEYSKDKKVLEKCPLDWSGKFIVPDFVEEIGAAAFQDCYNLTSVELPKGVITIGEWAFAGCKELVSIVIPDSIREIGENAFQDCPNLEVANLSEDVRAQFTEGFQNGNDC